jgi:hypothetical protein
MPGDHFQARCQGLAFRLRRWHRRREVEKGHVVDAHAIPPALRSRLGPEATSDLVDVLDLSQRDARDALIAACTERFERRLVDEISKVRVEMARLGADLRQEMASARADLRQEMATMGADLRQEMATMGANLRQEMATMGADLRQEMATMGAGLRQDIAAGRVELFKWCFLFWVGQVLAIVGLMGVMLRLLR